MYFITFGDHNFKNSKERILREAKDFGFSECKGYGPDDLDSEFREKFKDVLAKPRFGGYCLWKPWIIWKTLQQLKDGDYLVYADAGSTVNKYGKARFLDYIKMLDMSEYGIISFQMPHLEKRYVTKEIFEYFKCPQEIQNTGQYHATVLIMKKCEHLEKVINLWLKTAYDNVLLFTDFYNAGQEKYFIDNRHDQAIFSIIRKIHGSIVIPEDETFDLVIPWLSSGSLNYPFWATRIRG
jgi:hypothetical protein